MGILSGYKAISLFNDLDGVVVQINEENFSSEATLTHTELEPDKKDPRGNSPYAGEEHTLEIPVYDFAGRQQLQEWSRANTRLSAVAAGVQQNLQWYERDRTSIIDQTMYGQRGKINKFLVRMTRRSAYPKIYSNVNLYAYLGWQDADGDGLADGYYSRALGVVSFQNGIQSLTFPNTATADFGAEVVFPISGIPLTYAVTIANTIGDLALRAKQLIYDRSAIESNEIQPVDNGRKIINLRSVSQLWSIRADLFDWEGDEACDFSWPSLRSDSSDKYVGY